MTKRLIYYPNRYKLQNKNKIFILQFSSTLIFSKKQATKKLNIKYQTHNKKNKSWHKCSNVLVISGIVSTNNLKMTQSTYPFCFLLTTLELGFL